MAALLTAPPQNIAPPRSPHANTKAVCFCPVPAVGLISTFQDAMLPAWISYAEVELIRYLAPRTFVKVRPPAVVVQFDLL
jgi:hypothetical protein